MIIDGKQIAHEIQDEIGLEISKMEGRPPCLAVLLVGNHLPSLIYVDRKIKACEAVGMRSIVKKIASTISEADLINEVVQLNENEAVDGILLQLPLPPHINPMTIISHINPSKDVDGLHPTNLGKLLIGDKNTFAPCTPQGVSVLLQRVGVDVSGKEVLIIGRSHLVGKPMAAILMQNRLGANATVTIAHSKTKNLKELALRSDIIIVAIGSPKFITEEMVTPQTVVIDVGINKIDDFTKTLGYKIVGDVDFEKLKDKCAFITPVPGGVGPMTIAMLLSNTLKAKKLHNINLIYF